MFKGGIADKLGNRYEAKWLVRQLLDVIIGKAEWLRFEGITTDFNGFEFAVRRYGVTEWHQTKMSSPHGNWTIKALEREKVLSAFKRRLSENDNDICVFVSQDPVKSLQSLHNKVTIANSEKELFQEPSGIETIFTQLAEKWGIDSETTFTFLKRCKFRTIPESEIDSHVASLSDFCFMPGYASVYTLLREYLENRFNKIITTEIVRSDLRTIDGINIKDWSLNPTIREIISLATQNYLNTYSPFGAGGSVIPRQQTNEILNLIINPEGPGIILLTGNAGTGKSGIVRGVIEKLRSLNTLHLAFRVDHHLNRSTSQEIGEDVTGRRESPVITLKGTEPKKLSVLIIDQIDAVSEVSGRNGSLKEAILKMVNDARNLKTVRLMLVCRTFDFDSDSRLKSLKKLEGVKKIELPQLNWKEEVEPFLLEKGIDIKLLSSKQRELLCLPLHLAIFLEVKSEGLSFYSRNSLFDSLINKKERVLKKYQTITWSIKKPLTVISTWMSEHQTLNAPGIILDDFPSAMDVLTSEGLIVQSKNKVNFFHESFFDYLYARSFIGNNLSLVDLLNSTEQHLFRRTQARQILEILRQHKFQYYIQNLKEVLSNNYIRYHIKVAVTQWLGFLDSPTSEELEIILTLDNEQESFRPLVRYSLLSNVGWFDLLYNKGWILKVLNSNQEDRRKAVLWWLSNIAGDRPKDIASLMDKWWNDDSQRGARLLDWFCMVRRQKPDDELITLCVRVVRSKPDNLFERTGSSKVEWLLSTWVEDHSDKGANLLKALFDIWFDMHPNKHPFEDYKINDFEDHSLKQIAEKSPRAFIAGMIDAFIRSIDIANKRKLKGENDYTFMYYTFSEYKSGVGGFLGLFISSIQEVANKDPKLAHEFLSQMDPSKHDVYLHIHLEVISANGERFSNHLIDLLEYKNIFDVGWGGDEWRSFANTAKAAFPHLTATERKLIENKVFSHHPEIDIAIKTANEILKHGEKEPWENRSYVIGELNRSGREQLKILETIGEDLLSEDGIQQLKILRRKFPNYRIPELNKVQGGFVRSPISEVEAKYMNDDDWLNAIAHYNSDGKMRRRRNFLDGDAPQLASVLENLTKENPERFIKLMKRIPDDAHHSYIEHILRGLPETDEVNDKHLLVAIRNAHERPGKPFGKDITRVFEKHPQIAKDPYAFDALLWYLENGDASDDKIIEYENIKRETISIRDLIERGGKYYIRGINGERGSAAEALGRILWKVPELAARVWNILENRIETEPLISVRCCLITPLVPLFNNNSIRCAQLLEKLIRGPIKRKIDLKGEIPHAYLYPLITHQGVHLLPYILRDIPDIGQDLIDHLYNSGNETMHHIAAWLIFGQSFNDEKYISEANQLIEKGNKYRELAADVAADAILYDEFHYRAEQQLIKFFNDNDKEVRRQAAGVFHNIKPEDFVRFHELAKIFIDSQAFRDDSFGLLHVLKEATSDVQELVILAAEKIISIFGDEKKTDIGQRDLDLHHLKELLQWEYTSSENDPHLRKRILDIIDKMLEKELYGVHEILKAHERE